MDADRLKVLRQEVAAAEFLLRNLKSQLREAEEQANNTLTHQNDDLQTHRNSSRTALPNGNLLTEPSLHLTPAPDQEEPHLQSPSPSTPHTGPGDPQSPSDESDDNNNASDDEDAPAEDDPPIPTPLPTIEIGTLYPTLEHIKTAVTAHAISQGWTCRVYKRDRTRLLLRCRTAPDCPFHLRAEQYPDVAKICALKPEHTCAFQPDQSHVIRAHATKLSFLRRELPGIMDVTEKTTPREISDAVFERFGTRVSVKQCRHLKPGPRRKRFRATGTCSNCGGTGHNRLTCQRRMEAEVEAQGGEGFAGG